MLHKMAALPNARGWCVLEYARTDSVVAVRRAFRRQFGRPAPSETSIRRWYEQLRDRGCICHQGKGRAGRPSVNEETIERVRDSFIRSPKKSVRRASQQLQIPKSTVWKIARKRLQLFPYKLQMVHKLQPGDPAKRLSFCENFMAMIEEDEGLPDRIVMSDEATFHLSGKVNRHNVRIWRSENPHAVIQIERDSPKVNVFCAVSKRRVFGPFFFVENTINGNIYLDVLQNWLMPQLTAEMEQGFIFQQDGAPPHWHMDVRGYLNQFLPGRWIGRATNADNTFCTWPPRSPDLTVCDFFLWGYIKDSVYIPPLPVTLAELRRRITAASENITQDMLERVWREWDHRLDVCRITRGAHIECI